MIEAEELCKTYGTLRAVDDVSFTVAEREVFGLLGRNGSGKTTLLRILTGFRLPSSGRVRVAGFDVVRDCLDVRRRIGYVTENPQLYPDLTVRGQLRFVADVRGIPRGERKARIEAAASRFALEAVFDRLVGHCSKGYRQRVALAQAVLHGPSVVFLDEPTAGLDPEQRAATHALIRNLARETTVVLSSHDLDEVTTLCSRALIFDRGRVARLGTLAELGGLPGLAAAFRATLERAGRGPERQVAS